MNKIKKKEYLYVKDTVYYSKINNKKENDTIPWLLFIFPFSVETLEQAHSLEIKVNLILLLLISICI